MAGESVVRRTTNDVVRKTTSLRYGENPARMSAWERFLQPLDPKKKAKGAERETASWHPVRDHGLSSISTEYDQLIDRARRLDPAIDETEVLDGLLVVRQLRNKLLLDERRLIQAARARRVTWSRIATALELKSRQAAERRYLQLREDFDDYAHDNLTQAERVEFARTRRHRTAEYSWAIKHQEPIIRLAAQLSAVPDLQERADRSHEAHTARQRAANDATFRGEARPAPASLPWPGRLREAVGAYEAHLRATHDNAAPPLLTAGDVLAPARFNKLVHEMFGLIAHASDPVIALDHPDLARQVRNLYEAAGTAAPQDLRT
ncbi:hypothetical protein [Streptomyces sp. TLI_105]|uniref:hypothetical protein n=1 Tax=Streptomyces sp. TLI_105 TaxID=1881019 RepID=UPI00089CD95C|nr:hypothetical protein [Streptomyces sp. TLI_105]SEE60518.1 hypothetical protein SAMN05428939_8103 [Streptomyces sp. TLI_105]